MENKRNKVLQIINIIFLLGIIGISGYLSYVVSTYTKVYIAAILMLVVLLISFGLYKLSKKHSAVSIIIEIVLLAILVLIGNTAHATDSIVNKTVAKPEYETVCIVAMKDSGIESTDDLSSFRLGYINSEDGAYAKCSEILKENNKKVRKTVPKKYPKAVWKSFKEDKTQLMLLTDRMRASLDEIEPNYEKKIKVLFKKDYILKEAKAKQVNISKEPFVVYLQGSDASGAKNINSTGRGDANFLVAVNPKTQKVNLQVIPRDTYVNIPSMGGHSKLSYSGSWGGIQSSIESIEEKFDIDINYYAKINWQGIIDLVDALGGVEVYSQYEFYSSYPVNEPYHFVQGYNQMNGKKALAFVAERKSLPENELSRGKNQMALIKGIAMKFAENPNFDDAMVIMDKMSDSFVTNIPKKDYIKTFNVAVDLIPELKNLELKSMKGEFRWKTDEVSGEYKYYFYPEKNEIKRVKDDIENIKK